MVNGFRGRGRERRAVARGARSGAWDQEDVRGGDMTVTTYAVTGMTCEHCVHAVTEELARIGGVTAVNVELVPESESKVTVTSDAPLSEQSVAAALDEAGEYRLAGI
jgi:copper chaperone CopZ